MVEAGGVRNSGRTTAEEVADEEADDLLADIEEAMLPEERDRDFTHLSFSTMRIEWRRDDAAMLRRIHDVVERLIREQFVEAFDVIDYIHSLVRVEPKVDAATGEVLPGEEAFDPYDDWSRLGIKDRSELLDRIAVSMFDWEQRAAILWGDVMLAKGIWKECFGVEFNRPAKGTVPSRTAVADMRAAEDRYFALFQAIINRRAEALNRSMDRLTRIMLAQIR